MPKASGAQLRKKKGVRAPPYFRGELGETGPLGGCQGRFKSFAVEEDDYFLTLCRYVEANALRAELVERAEDWQWSGLWRRIHDKQGEDLARPSPWPVERPRNWTARVNGALAEEQLQAASGTQPYSRRMFSA